MNDNIVNFDNILEDIWDNRFTFNLLSVFKIIANRKPTAVDNPFTGGKVQDRNGQKRKHEKNEDVRVINEKADDDLKIKKGENWRNIFCGDKGKNRVKWNNDGLIMCPLWFLRQYCFDNCYHKESHMSDDKVPEGKRKEYKSYFGKIRK